MLAACHPPLCSPAAALLTCEHVLCLAPLGLLCCRLTMLPASASPLPAADVYFPKRKDTFRRRPFCFVTFARLEDAQCAIAESPMNICGIPIKQLNLVEDRADYYKHRHNGAPWSGFGFGLVQVRNNALA